jgi:hypothetical protein
MAPASRAFPTRRHERHAAAFSRNSHRVRKVNTEDEGLVLPLFTTNFAQSVTSQVAYGLKCIRAMPTWVFCSRRLAESELRPAGNALNRPHMESLRKWFYKPKASFTPIFANFLPESRPIHPPNLFSGWCFCFSGVVLGLGCVFWGDLRHRRPR